MNYPSAEPNRHTEWPFPFSPADWGQTPPAVQAYLAALHQQVAHLTQRVETPEARTHATSATSNRPPSSDSPFRKGRKNHRRTSAGRPGAKPGHPGIRQTLLSPTAREHRMPTACRCGHTALGHTTPYYTHQVIELPPIKMDITHWTCIRLTAPAVGTASRRTCPPNTRPDTARGSAP